MGMGQGPTLQVTEITQGDGAREAPVISATSSG